MTYIVNQDRTTIHPLKGETLEPVFYPEWQIIADDVTYNIKLKTVDFESGQEVFVLVGSFDTLKECKQEINDIKTFQNLYHDVPGAVYLVTGYSDFMEDI